MQHSERINECNSISVLDIEFVRKRPRKALPPCPRMLPSELPFKATADGTGCKSSMLVDDITTRCSYYCSPPRSRFRWQQSNTPKKRISAERWKKLIRYARAIGKVSIFIAFLLGRISRFFIVHALLQRLASQDCRMIIYKEAGIVCGVGIHW